MKPDGCIACHVTPQIGTTMEPRVSCQSCHPGSALHVASKGKLRTTGSVDCRSCHDARHHPTFRRGAAWPLVQHGREAEKKP